MRYVSSLPALNPSHSNSGGSSAEVRRSQRGDNSVQTDSKFLTSCLGLLPSSFGYSEAHSSQQTRPMLRRGFLGRFKRWVRCSSRTLPSIPCSWKLRATSDSVSHDQAWPLFIDSLEQPPEDRHRRGGQGGSGIGSPA